MYCNILPLNKKSTCGSFYVSIGYNTIAICMNSGWMYHYHYHGQSLLIFYYNNIIYIIIAILMYLPCGCLLWICFYYVKNKRHLLFWNIFDAYCLYWIEWRYAFKTFLSVFVCWFVEWWWDGCMYKLGWVFGILR